MTISRREMICKSLLACSALAAYSAIPCNASLESHYPGKVPIIHAPSLPLYDGDARVFDKVIMLGDSNSAGSGQDYGFHGGVMGRLSRSILNRYDALSGRDRGGSYVTLMSPYQEILPINGWSGYIPNGYIKGGATGNLGVFNPGSWVENSGRSITTINFYFDAARSLGAEWEVSVGKEVIMSGVAGPDGATGYLDIPKLFGSFQNRKPIRFSCVSGTIYYQGAEMFDKGPPSPLSVWCAPEGSQGFAEFSSYERLSSISTRVNAHEGNTLICVFLGSNNFLPMSVQHVPPKEYIDLIVSFVEKWRSAVSGEKTFAMAVPPRPRLELPFGRYEEYAGAMAEYSEKEKDISLIRTDLSVLGGELTESLYSSDGIHLNSSGHRAWAEVACNHFGIPYDDYYQLKSS